MPHDGSGGMSRITGVGDDVSFELRLEEAIARCRPRAQASNPAGSLRSGALQPRVLEVDRPTIVRSLAEARAHAVGDVRPASALAGGRLIVYFPDEELSDGAAETETEGFFDGNNAPPWDTWIALFRDDGGDLSIADQLVSWVPHELVDLVARGIHVNPEQCIRWLDDTRLPLAARLRSMGLLS